MCRIKFAGWNGVGAYLACGWCLYEGEAHKVTNPGKKASSTIYYHGFLVPTPQRQNPRQV